MLGDGLEIRALESNDGASLFELIERNRERLKDYFPGTIAAIPTLEASGNYVVEKLALSALRELYTMVLVDTEAVLRGLFIIKNVDWQVRKCELAYFIDQTMEGRGIMTTALGAVVKYAFDVLGMKRLYIITAADNIPSRRIAEKNGFEQEGIIRQNLRLSTGRLADNVCYGLLKKDKK